MYCSKISEAIREEKDIKKLQIGRDMKLFSSAEDVLYMKNPQNTRKC